MTLADHRADVERLAAWAERKHAEAERRQRDAAVGQRVAQLTLDAALAQARHDLARQRARDRAAAALDATTRGGRQGPREPSPPRAPAAYPHARLEPEGLSSMPNRRCLAVGCQRLTAETYCPDHKRAKQRARDVRRGAPAERGYNNEYRRNRKRVLEVSRVCHWCGRYATTADHLVPLAHGGTNDLENLVPACRDCNSSRGSNPNWRPPTYPRGEGRATRMTPPNGTRRLPVSQSEHASRGV